MNGFLIWLLTTKDVLLEPAAFYEEIEVADVGAPIVYAVLSFTLFGVLARMTALFSYTFAPTPGDLLLVVIGALVIGLIGGLIVVPVVAAMLTVFVAVLSGRSAESVFSDAVVLTGYASAAVVVAGWWPRVGMVLAAGYVTYLLFSGAVARMEVSREQAMMSALGSAATIVALVTFGRFLAAGSVFDLWTYVPRFVDSATWVIFQLVV